MDTNRVGIGIVSTVQTACPQGDRPSFYATNATELVGYLVPPLLPGEVATEEDLVIFKACCKAQAIDVVASDLGLKLEAACAARKSLLQKCGVENVVQLLGKAHYELGKAHQEQLRLVPVGIAIAGEVW